MRSNSLSRRRFLQLGLAGGGVGALAACGAATPAPGASTAPTGGAASELSTAPAGATAAAATGEKVTLSVLNENWGDVYNKLMTVIGDEFSKEHPDVALEWNFDPDWRTKLTTLVAANTPPDASMMTPPALTTFASKGALMELGPLLNEAGITRDAFITPLYDSSIYDGKLYAIPGGANYLCMMYSKDVFREAGLDPEKPPATFDELLEQSKAILIRDASGDIQRIGYNPVNFHFVHWAHIFGGQFYDSESKKITANHPANVEALTRIQEYVKTLDINKLTAFNQRPGLYEAGNAFASKQATFDFNGFWVYEAFDQFAPDIDYAVAFWPTVKGTPEERKNYTLDGWLYSIPTGSPHSQQAWDFMRYAFIDQSAKMGVMTLNGTCVKAQFPQWESGVLDKIGAKNRLAPYLKTFTQTGDAATRFFPVIPVQAYYQDEINRIYDLVVRGEATPQAGLDEVTKNVQAELDKVAR